MATVPNDDIPFINRLSQILRKILNAIHHGAICLFHALWPHVVRAWNAAKDFVVAHPKLIIALVMLVLAVLLAQPLANGIVTLLGFGSPGVQAGSLAAQFQSHLYGGTVPAGSLFAFLQSFGARI